MRYRILSMAALIVAMGGLFSGCQTWDDILLGVPPGANPQPMIEMQSGQGQEGAWDGQAGGVYGLSPRPIDAWKTFGPRRAGQEHGYEPGDAPLVKILDASAMPGIVYPNRHVTATMKYVVLGLEPDATVTEVRKLFNEGRLLAELSKEVVPRSDGVWLSRQDIRIPRRFYRGTYTIVQRLETPWETITTESTFEVH